MSGNAALSAAKNRRSAGMNVVHSKQTPKPTSCQMNNSSPLRQVQPQQTNDMHIQIQERPKNVIELLYNHEFLLKKHDDELSSLIDINNEIKNESGQDNKIAKLENEIADLKKEVLKVMELAKETAAQLKNYTPLK